MCNRSETDTYDWSNSPGPNQKLSTPGVLLRTTERDTAGPGGEFFVLQSESLCCVAWPFLLAVVVVAFWLLWKLYLFLLMCLCSLSCLFLLCYFLFVYSWYCCSCYCVTCVFVFFVVFSLFYFLFLVLLCCAVLFCLVLFSFSFFFALTACFFVCVDGLFNTTTTATTTTTVAKQQQQQ